MTAADRWSGGDDYEAYIGRWSRPVARVFIEWLGAPRGARWLDLGCGTGALTETILERARPASIVAIDPSADFVEHARAAIADGRAHFAVGSAGSVPLPDDAVDVAVSGLVLNFVPNVPAGLADLRRVVAPGGCIAGYVWDYAAGMELIRRFWDAAIALDSAAAALDEAVRFPLCAPEPLGAAFEAAGLSNVDVRPIDVATRFRDFDELWAPFRSGVGPAPSYAAGLEEPRRTQLRDRLRDSLREAGDGSISLTARAWAVRARTDGPGPRR